ncbi:MAG: hypothetical protein A2521_01845 [Deltaproteobacteria bacterium RIFOXYD12_FULL_57_12]|nr:MAG: hypothetical protein A2521_01845 [Deltaproteobacteria bacterium RIFOXYD12_FULL_57_12]
MTEKKIPTYTKIGIRITTVLILLLAIMIARNCVRSINYGTTTSDKDIERYFNLGFEAGARGGLETNATEVKETEQDNPLLKKAYQRGFRAGRDGTPHGQGQTGTPGKK